MSQLIKEVFGSFEAELTRESEDATRIAREALRSGCRMIVSVGGDGTLNDVVNGFFQLESGKPVPINPEAVLGIIPRGTGGDFRKTLGIPRDYQEAVTVLRQGNNRQIDLGQLEFMDHRGGKATRIFINIASFGIGGEVDERVNRSSKILGGRISFFRSTLAASLAYRNKKVVLRIDGEKSWEGSIYNVAVANGQYFGGGMWIAPEASLEDGIFEIVVMGDFGLGDAITGGIRVYEGRHLEHPKVEVFRGKRIEAYSGERVLLDVDGEQPGCLPAVISILPGSIQIRG